MKNFNSKIYKFMQGRYGVDELYKFLFGCYFFVLIIDLFINYEPLALIEATIVIIIFYRFFSKKIYQRRKENQIYLQLKAKFNYKIKETKKRLDGRKTKIFKKCPQCKTILKLSLPSKRGMKHVVCPKCKKRITMLCLRQEKVEVIINKKVKNKA